jgi:hypothetical protein
MNDRETAAIAGTVVTAATASAGRDAAAAGRPH